MSENFVVRSNSTLDRIANSATSVEEMKEQMKAALEHSGTLTRDRDGYVTGQSAQPAFERNVGRLIRVIYPGGNDRYELYADTEEGLDAKEAKIRAMYPAR